MKGHGRIAVMNALVSFIGMILIAGCASAPPLTSGGKTTPYFISCNVPGAQVITQKGNIVGEVPVEGEIRWEGWNKFWSPYGEMVKVKKIPHPQIGGPRIERRYYFVGKIVAPGYRQKEFREYIGYNENYAISGLSQDLVDRIVINAYLEATARGMVMVSSTQENAEVYVDGAFVGNSPANLKLSEGIHIVEVKKNGFKSYKKELRVIGSSELNLRVTLERE